MFAIACACILSACAHHLPRADKVEPLASLGWLSGSWFSVDAGSESEEHWTHPRGATMVGMARTLVAGQTQFFEYMRIEARENGEIVLLASPKGREPAVEFTLTSKEATKVVFENLTHDFPQRISYWREGNRLFARLEGDVGGESNSVTFEWRAATW